MSVRREVLFSTYKTEISATVCEDGYITLRDGGNTISELSLIPAKEAQRIVEILESAINEVERINRGEA